jgi:hypothetical protein
MALAHSWTAQCSETQFSLLHAQKPEEAQCLAAWKFDRKVCGTGGTTRMCFRYRHHCKLLCFSTFYNINEKTVVWRDRRVCVKLTSVFFVHWFISTLSHTHILVCVVGVCVCVCVECGLGNWNEQWWLSDSKKKMETTLLDAPDYYSLLWNFVSKLPNGKNVFDLPNIFQKCLCEKQSWSYTDFIGGLDVEKSPTTHKIFYYFCCWVSYLKKKNPSPSRLSCLRRWVYFFLGGGLVRRAISFRLCWLAKVFRSSKWQPKMVRVLVAIAGGLGSVSPATSARSAIRQHDRRMWRVSFLVFFKSNFFLVNFVEIKTHKKKKKKWRERGNSCAGEEVESAADRKWRQAERGGAWGTTGGSLLPSLAVGSSFLCLPLTHTAAKAYTHIDRNRKRKKKHIPPLLFPVVAATMNELDMSTYKRLIHLIYLF